MSLIDVAQNRWRTVLSILFFILIAGAFSYVAIPKESDPDIAIPIIYVTLNHSGISPADSERLLIRPIEDKLKSIEGVKEMRSEAFDGGGFVLLEFEAGFDSDKAIDNVREKVDFAKVNLPDDSDEPIISEVNLSLFPVLNIALHGNVTTATLQKLSEDLSDAIESISEVLQVDEVGKLTEQIEIVIDPKRIEIYELDIAHILSAIQLGNRLVAAGSMRSEQSQFNIKVPGLVETQDDLNAFPLVTQGDSVLTVSDIADVRLSYKDPEGVARTFGKPAIVLKVVKRTGKNIIDTIAKVRHVVGQVTSTWPESVSVTISQDQSNQINDMLLSLQNNVLSAVLLVMIVIIGVLGLRSGLLVGVAIPGSFLTGVLVLYLLGVTVNVVVLFSLILSVGILVDGAIVICEYADRKIRAEVPFLQAYSQAARHMAWPIGASTATTLAAFLPLLFWPGLVGEFMKFLPVTLISVLSASLLMALIFLPVLGVQMMRFQHWVQRWVSIVEGFISKYYDNYISKKSNIVTKPEMFQKKQILAQAQLNNGHETVDNGMLYQLPTKGMTAIYVKTLKTVLQWPILTIMGAFCLMVLSIVSYIKFGQEVEFFPEVDPEQISLHIGARGDLSIIQKARLVGEAEQRILELHRKTGEFLNITALVGQAGKGGEDRANDVIGVVDMELINWRKRRNSRAIIHDVRTIVEDIPGLRFELRYRKAGPPRGKAVHLEFYNGTAQGRINAVEKTRNFFESNQIFVDIEDSIPLTGVEWNLEIDRAQASKFDVNIDIIGKMIRLFTQGLKLSEFRSDQSRDEVEIVARAPKQLRSIDELDAIRIVTANGNVPISDFVRREGQLKTGALKRVDGHPIQFIKSDVQAGILPDTAVQTVQKWIQSESFEPGVQLRIRGEDADQKEAQSFLTKAFIVAMFLMGIILLTQFNSFWFAGIILTAVALSSTGVLIGLLITDRPFSIIMSGIGAIALAGIIVNNNIVLIDTYERLRKIASTDAEAILHTGAQRLRPVLLTTTTTICGLIPMVTEMNFDFLNRVVEIGGPSTQFWVQLATAITFGLIFATPFTLLVTPAALILKTRFFKSAS